MRSNKKLLAAITAFSMLFAPLSTAWTAETAIAKESTNKGIKSNGQAEKTIADLDAALLQKAQRAMKQLTGKEVELEAALESNGTT
ncbi:hypothetical protein AZ66_18355 [Paenibacillus sp. E194]|uniref:hypothetical protein n=1 Tax=Paenibacillus sp. E194 TaxID=1458845 RepID=UPI0005C8F0EA|nr:hypothetical protein [Paenibacillus sp. E194]KJB86520.1 hypothetical protein AZ66_18355 [Paenibacillus sp. E194]